MADDRHNEPTLDQLTLRWIRLLPAEDPDVNAAFGTFVRWSPEHLKAFLKHKALATELQGLDKGRNIDVAALVARVRSRSNVILWPGPTLK